MTRASLPWPETTSHKRVRNDDSGPVHSALSDLQHGSNAALRYWLVKTPEFWRKAMFEAKFGLRSALLELTRRLDAYTLRTFNPQPELSHRSR
ncbi:hypothetical protein GCM10027269_83650 [Kribbella endophytica]